MLLTEPSTTHDTFADLIDRTASVSRDRLWDSTLGHDDAINELITVTSACRKDDWDAHGASAVHPDSVTLCYRVIKSLPLGFPSPTIGAEPDGQVTLEWYKSTSRVLSVSVDPVGLLHYAGLFGRSKHYGTITFTGQAPDQLMKLVQDL
jgi:hypothetical protein